MSDVDDTIQTEQAIRHLHRYFHIYEGWSYYTLRCGICQQMFGIKPNLPILERSSFDMLMNHAKAHNKTPTGPLDYSRQHPPTKGAIRSLEAQDEPYDAADDFGRSLDDCYHAIRERVAASGKGWEPRGDGDGRGGAADAGTNQVRKRRELPGEGDRRR